MSKGELATCCSVIHLFLWVYVRTLWCMQQSIAKFGQHTNVVIDCASSDCADALLHWVRQSPKGNAISVRLPSLCPDHSPSIRRMTGELLSLGCSVTLKRTKVAVPVHC